MSDQWSRHPLAPRTVQLLPSPTQHVGISCLVPLQALPFLESLKAPCPGIHGLLKKRWHSFQAPVLTCAVRDETSLISEASTSQFPVTAPLKRRFEKLVNKNSCRSTAGSSYHKCLKNIIDSTYVSFGEPIGVYVAQLHPHNKADRANMEFDKLDADVQAFIQTGIKNYGHVDTPGDYAWLTPMIMKYGVELTCGNLFLQGPGDQRLDPLPNAATLKKVLSKGPPVRKLFIGHIRLPEFEFAFRTKDQCPSLKEVCFEFVACNRGPVHLNDCGPFQGLCSLQLCAGGTSAAYAEDIASYLRNNRSLKELTLRMSCGDDEGISMLLEALKVNDTLKRFSLLAMALTFDNLISFAKMLPSNSTLELVTLDEVCKGEEDELALCLDQGLYPGAFNRLDFSWRDTLFNKLTALTRKEGCAPRLHVCVPSLAGKKDIRRFFESLPPVTTLRELHLRTTDDICDPYTDGIAYLLKRTSSLREIIIRPSIPAHKENNLLSVFDALKKNRSVTKFSIETEEMTPRISAVLSELVAVNSTLNDLTVYPLKFMLRERVLMIEKGFRMNYTLTKFDMGRKGGDEEQRIGELLKRNITLENKAAMCVISGVEASDTAGLDALSKVHSGTGLVKKVQMITGRTREEALDDIEKAVARLPL